MPHDDSSPGHASPGDSHHGHSHHGHSHAPPKNFDRAFALGAGLNAAFVAIQVGFGLAAGSVALIADALHNLGDVLGLLLAWGAAGMGRRVPTARRTYGWGRSSILASLINAVVLLLGAGAIAVEAVQRFGHPAPVAGGTVIWVAAIGILVNGGTALMFMRGRENDLNVRGAFMHLLADALVSVGVLLSGAGIMLTGWQWLDPITSLVIVGIITWGTWGLLVQSIDLTLDAVPQGVDPEAVAAALAMLPGVDEVHDLHIWALSTTQNALTAHLVSGGADETLVEQACAMLHDRFGLDHATRQVESPGLAARCRLRPAEIV